MKTITAGASTVEEIGASCGAGTDCGTCQGALEAMLAPARAFAREAGSKMTAQLVAPSRLVQRGAVEARCASPERDAA